MNVLFYIVSLIFYLQLNQEIKDDTFRNSLSFELNPNDDIFWRNVGSEDIIERMVGINSVYSDSKTYIDGKQSWVITSKKKNFNTCVYAYLNLPKKAKKTKVSIYSKTTILDK